MPLSYDQLTAITRKSYMPKLVDNVFDSNPLVQRLKKKSYESVDGGEKIVAPLNYAMTNASGWYTGSQLLDTADNENITGAEYEWKQVYATIAITRKEELQNSGDAKILSLLKSKIQIAEKTVMDKFGTGIYSNGTTDPKSIVGLRAIISASSTVGGISQSSYSWWAAKVDTTTTTLSIPALQTRYNLCTVNNDSPTVIAATRSIYNSYYALLQPQQRFMDAETAKGGFQSLMFNGTPFIADSYAPTSNLVMLNEKYLHLWYHPSENMRFRDFQEPINQNVKVGQIFWMGAFGSDNNRLHGGFTALTA